MSEQPIKMFLNWDDQSEMFVMTYNEGEKLIFQVRMDPQSFENLTSDMVRTVKNYNLYQLQKKQEKENEEKANLVNTDEKSIRLEGSPNESENPFSEKT